jgi:hypothetical protein
VWKGATAGAGGGQILVGYCSSKSPNQRCHNQNVRLIQMKRNQTNIFLKNKKKTITMITKKRL